MTTIVRAADAAEFLSLVPRLLGCHVTRSVVLVPFAGSRTLGAMRVDLPPREADADRIAATLLGMICRVASADGVALVVYSPHAVARDLPHRELAEAVCRRADAAGLRLVDALCVGAGAWGSYLEPAGSAAPRPLVDVSTALPAGAERLPTPASDLLSGLALPETDPAFSAEWARALDSFGHAVEVLCGPAAAEQTGAFGERRRPEGRIDPRALSAALLLDDLPSFYEDSLSWDPSDLDLHAGTALVWCLDRPALRDIALMGWSGHVRDADEALRAQLAWEEGEEYPAHLAMRMWGEGERPDPGRLTRALTLVRTLAAATTPDRRGGLLAMCGWLSWALGRSTHAAHYAGLALETDPAHGLAEIVRSFVDAGHLPDWAFERRGAAPAT